MWSFTETYVMAVRVQEMNSPSVLDINDQLVNNDKFSCHRIWSKYYSRFPYWLIKISKKGAMFLVIFNFLFAPVWLTMWELILVQLLSFSTNPSLGVV